MECTLGPESGVVFTRRRSAWCVLGRHRSPYDTSPEATTGTSDAMGKSRRMGISSKSKVQCKSTLIVAVEIYQQQQLVQIGWSDGSDANGHLHGTTDSGALLHLPLFCHRVVVAADDQLERPEREREEDVHPPPPHLRGVVEHYPQARVSTRQFRSAEIKETRTHVGGGSTR